MEPVSKTSNKNAPKKSVPLRQENREGAIPRVGQQETYTKFKESIVTSSFDRLCNSFTSDPQLLSCILFHCKLKTLLALRSVSRSFYPIVSLPTLFDNEKINPLQHKATLRFEYGQIHPVMPEEIEKKFNFAKHQGLLTQVIISTNELNQFDPLIINEKTRIILKIRDVVEFGAFTVPRPSTNFINELDLSELSINSLNISSINAFLNTFCQNLGGASNLSSIILGDISASICNKTQFNFPPSLKSVTIKNINFQNLDEVKRFRIVSSSKLPGNCAYIIKELNLQKIDMYKEAINCFSSPLFSTASKLALGRIAGTFTLSDAFEKLTELTIGPVHYECRLKLPDYMPCLQNLSVKWMGKRGSIVELPKVLPKLTTITCSISSECTIDWSRISFPSLTTLVINEIENDVTFKLPAKLSKLKTLKIGKIGKNSEIQLPEKLFELSSLTIGDMQSKAGIKFPQSLNNLETLDIGNIYDGCKLELPTNLNSLKKLIIKSIYKRSYLKLPDSLNNLTDLTVQNIKEGAIFDLPKSLNSLINFTIGSISNDIRFPDKLNSLENFTIGCICSNVTLTLLDAFQFLNSLTINELQSNVTLRLPDFRNGQAQVLKILKQSYDANIGYESGIDCEPYEPYYNECDEKPVGTDSSSRACSIQ